MHHTIPRVGVKTNDFWEKSFGTFFAGELKRMGCNEFIAAHVSKFYFA
jgi:hypothetical protein